MTHTVITDIPRFYTALAEWSACLIFIIIIKNRLSTGRTILAAIAALLLQSVFFVFTGNVPILLWIPCMLVAAGGMVLFIYLCCDIRWRDAFYFGMQAFVTAELAASFEWQVLCFFWPDRRLPSIWIQLLLLVIIYGIINWVIWKILKYHLPKDGKMGLNDKEIISAFVIVVAVFAVSNLSFLTTKTPFSGQYVSQIANIRTLVDLGGVAMIYAHMVQCSEMRIRKELESVQNVLQNQYQQYKQSRESIDLINYKYHDLKHQIAVIRSEEDPGRREAYLSKMEDEIKQYELQNKTGNQVLDTVLTSKSLYCNKHGITLTCVADGTLLEFMDVMDICSIFGNALDNAIEYEKKIKDREKRLIHVTVSRQKNFLMIRVENYYEGKPKARGTAFATTKENKEFHGYGIKSIQYTLNRYDGAMSIDTSDSWFELKALVPIPEMEE